MPRPQRNARRREEEDEEEEIIDEGDVEVLDIDFSDIDTISSTPDPEPVPEPPAPAPSFREIRLTSNEYARVGRLPSGAVCRRDESTGDYLCHVPDISERSLSDWILEEINPNQTVDLFMDRRRSNRVSGKIIRKQKKGVIARFNTIEEVDPAQFRPNSQATVGQELCFFKTDTSRRGANATPARREECGTVREVLPNGHVKIEVTREKRFDVTALGTPRAQSICEIYALQDLIRDIPSFGGMMTGVRATYTEARVNEALQNLDALMRASTHNIMPMDLSLVVQKRNLMKDVDVDAERAAGKSPGHIYFHTMLQKFLKNKPDDDPDHFQQQFYYVNAKVINDIVQQTQTYRELRARLHEYLTNPAQFFGSVGVAANMAGRFSPMTTAFKQVMGAAFHNLVREDMHNDRSQNVENRAHFLDQNLTNPDWNRMNQMIAEGLARRAATQRLESPILMLFNERLASMEQLINNYEANDPAFDEDIDGRDILLRTAKRFGLRQVNYGLSSQDDERDAFARMLYVGFKDLANATGLKPHHIGLGKPVTRDMEAYYTLDAEDQRTIARILQNNIAVGYANTMQGRRRPYFDASNNALMTQKKKVGGVIAHEWARALDYALYKATKEASTDTAQYDNTTKATVQSAMNRGFWDFTGASNTFIDAFDDLRRNVIFSNFCETGRQYDDIWRSIGSDMQNRRRRAALLRRQNRDAINVEIAPPTPQQLMDQFASNRKFITARYSVPADGIYDQNRNRWGMPSACFARAFEAYISDKVENPFLVFPNKPPAGTVWDTIPENDRKIFALYPQFEERIALNQKFDQFFQQGKNEFDTMWGHLSHDFNPNQQAVSDIRFLDDEDEIESRNPALQERDEDYEGDTDDYWENDTDDEE